MEYQAYGHQPYWDYGVPTSSSSENFIKLRQNIDIMSKLVANFGVQAISCEWCGGNHLSGESFCSG